MKDNVRKMIYEYGADVCGFASIERFHDAPEGFHPCDIYQDCKTVIVFGVALPKGLFMVESRLIYGHFNNNCCPKVDEIAFRTAKFIEKVFNCIAVPIPCDSPYEYWDEDKKEGRGLISMKHAAVNAGIGTLGKNTLLQNKEYGNRLTLGAVLTNIEFQPDPLAEKICLDRCDLCIKNCPVKALDGKQANQKLCRMNTYGKTERGFDTVDCNKCRTVCPVRFGADIGSGVISRL